MKEEQLHITYQGWRRKTLGQSLRPKCKTRGARLWFWDAYWRGNASHSSNSRQRSIVKTWVKPTIGRDWARADMHDSKHSAKSEYQKSNKTRKHKRGHETGKRFTYHSPTARLCILSVRPSVCRPSVQDPSSVARSNVFLLYTVQFRVVCLFVCFGLTWFVALRGKRYYVCTVFFFKSLAINVLGFFRFELYK